MAQEAGGRHHDLEERLLDYSVGIIRVVDELPVAQSAESLRICLKGAAGDQALATADSSRAA
jgi:hypothetical protein